MTKRMTKLTPTTNDAIAQGALVSTPPYSNGKRDEAIPTSAVISHMALQEQSKNVTPVLASAPILAPSLKIALVGTAPSSRTLAPFNDPSWKIWVCSPGNMNAVPRVDAWFEIHGSMFWPEYRQAYGENYVNWLRQQTFPIYMQNKDFVPNAIPLPMDSLVAEFGGDFFSSSFAWMMAMAIRMGATEIALYGIDMASRDEYILQRPGFYFFRHIARQRGIKVSAPTESDIMQSPTLYGFSEVTPFGRKILARKAELKQRLAEMKTQQSQLQQSIPYLEGALEDLDYVETIWGAAQSHPLVKQGQEQTNG